MPRLIVIRGADEGKQFELDAPSLSAGRESSNPIRLTDTEVSRRHAEFRRTEEGYRVVDIGSANGTAVNGKSARDVLLRPGDQVQIGQTLLLYSDERTGEAAPPDLADQISLLTRQEQDIELSSAVVKTVGELEGSRILAQPELVQGNWLKIQLANLRVMYETSQAVSHILDLNQLFEKILDLIFQSIRADRGCIVLRNADGDTLEPAAVRWGAGQTRQERMPVSRTVVDYVLRHRQGVLVSDAARDDRFRGGQSVVSFGIREVICVPMKGRHETLGVLYLDTQLPPEDGLLGSLMPGKFTDEHLLLASAIAHQAALAVEETRYHQALVQAERLAAVGQTIAALSHHIKNILQGLRSGHEILRMGLADKNESLLTRGLALIEKNQGKIYELVMDMLSYSKERVPAIEETDIAGVVRDVVELVEGRARERKVRLEVRPGELPRVQADPEGLHRALLNIVGNALDAVEDREDSEVAVTTEMEDGEWVLIHVRDNGPGIPPARRQDVFKPFVSTKGARGTGLGLPVSRKILREHGGDLTVSGGEGGGSCFTLRLPVRSPLAQEAARRTADMDTLLPPEPD